VVLAEFEILTQHLLGCTDTTTEKVSHDSQPPNHDLTL